MPCVCDSNMGIFVELNLFSSQMRTKLHIPGWHTSLTQMAAMCRVHVRQAD